MVCFFGVRVARQGLDLPADMAAGQHRVRAAFGDMDGCDARGFRETPQHMRRQAPQHRQEDGQHAEGAQPDAG
ncbi:hypothetical protein G6F68_018604 [Rhizopus microsporus]|nr:hypothetical protein G6F68_018604 [Rhizopus microsporus]